MRLKKGKKSSSASTSALDWRRRRTILQCLLVVIAVGVRMVSNFANLQKTLSTTSTSTTFSTSYASHLQILRQFFVRNYERVLSFINTNSTDVKNNGTQPLLVADDLELEPQPKTVITMGLCITPKLEAQIQGNSILQARQNKRYDLAAVMATRLWKQQDPTLKVIVALVYSNGSSEQAEIHRISRLVKRAGGIPWPVNIHVDNNNNSNKTYHYNNPSLACIHGAQLSRVFAFESGLINDDDMMVVSDSDAFVVNVTKRLEPVRSRRNALGEEYKLWISTFDKTLHWNLPTHMMVFTAMRSKDWRYLLRQIGQQTSLQAAIAFGASSQQPGPRIWSFDQALVSSVVAKSGWCVIPYYYGDPADNRMHKYYWRLTQFLKGYNPQELGSKNDTLTCNRGSDETDGSECKDGVRGNRCSWVHFSPDVSTGRLEGVYKTIAGRYPPEGYMNLTTLYGNDRDPRTTTA